MQETSFDWDLVVSDDHSSDNTLSIIKERLGRTKVSCIILDSKKNVGISKNYERSFLACHGEYIAIMEGDDYWTDPKRLQKHVTFLDAHRECVMSFNRRAIYDQERGRFWAQHWESSDDFEYITTSQLIKRNYIGNLSTCVIRRSDLQKIKPGLFDIGAGDWIMGMTLGQFGLLARMKDVMSVYRIHAGGVWNRRSNAERRSRLIKNIDQYNQFLDYYYDSEFRVIKRQLRLRQAGIPKAVIRMLLYVNVLISIVTNKVKNLFG